MKLKTIKQIKDLKDKKVWGMEKQHRRVIKQYVLTILLTIGGIIALLVATGYEGPILKKLSIAFLALLAVFTGLSVADLMDDSVDTTAEMVEVEQEVVSTAPERVDIGQEPSLTAEELLQIRDLISRADDNLYLVTEVIDGDTIKIEGDMKVRLIGINAPEGGKCYYEEARNELVRLVQGKYVRLEKDVTAVDDRGRILSYVFLPSGDLLENNIFVNDHLLRQGYVREFSYGRNKLYTNVFIKARDQAFMARRGLWGACDEYVDEYEQENIQYREMHALPTDPECTIKGNISRQGAGKVYFFLGCSSYNLVKIDTRKGEQYFCTEQEAIAAGFKKSGNCP
ncbi:thermonuclease family protein [Patescibacteria group bacterium AH-259-L05]|nr:thermonuclease family protein [Patescibacteria group bacterium AH-259-L05]